VKIFNRWGTKVWEASGYDNVNVVWTGKNQSGQALPDGTYYYIVELYDTDGSVLFSESKWVEITR
jgi:flagellar hook assembly protein FlgD